MSNMKTIALMLAAGMAMGGNMTDERALNDRERYKGKGFKGGESILRTFTIKGIQILATDKKMAKKKYAAMNK